MPQRESEREETGGAGKKKKRTPEKKRRPNVPTNLPGQSGLVGQGSVTQQSKFQDFQSVTAPFSSRERKPLQETESCERTSTRGGERKRWTGLDWRREKKADREPQLIKSVSQELDHAGVDQSELSA